MRGPPPPFPRQIVGDMLMMPSQGLCKQPPPPPSPPHPPLKEDLGSLTSGSGKHLSKQIGPAGRWRQPGRRGEKRSAQLRCSRCRFSSSFGLAHSDPQRALKHQGPTTSPTAPSLSRSIIAAAAFSFCGSVSSGRATLLIPHPTHQRGAVTMRYYFLFPGSVLRSELPVRSPLAIFVLAWVGEWPTQQSLQPEGATTARRNKPSARRPVRPQVLMNWPRNRCSSSSLLWSSLVSNS